MPALRPAVSSPLPCEPDLRISPHPALERSPARAATVVGEVPAPRSGTARRYSPATSFHPIVPLAHWTPSPCRRLSRPPWWRVTATQYGSSATPRRQQRTARLRRTSRGSAGTAGTLPTFTHRPVGRVGAQLYPGGIAARYRNTPRGLDRPIEKRSAETIPNSNRDRAPQQPIAASFGAAVLYRGF